MPHPDRDGVHDYLSYAQARQLLAQHADVEHAERMLAHPALMSAPMPGRPGDRAYRAEDIDYLCRLLAGDDPDDEG